MSKPSVTSGLKNAIPKAIRKSLSGLATRLGLKKTWDEKFYAEVSTYGKDSPNAWIRRSSEIGGWLFAGLPGIEWETDRGFERVEG